MKTINITSHGKLAAVAIQYGRKKTKELRFGSLDAAKQFVLPRGNRNTDLRLNGYKCVLAGWV